MRYSKTSRNRTGFVNNWQSGKSLPECNLHMLRSEDSSDVIFHVGAECHVMRAHRYVLMSRSCVFHELLTSLQWTDSRDPLIIPDTEVEPFAQFLFYLYTNYAQIHSNNIHGLTDLARKYRITGLEQECLKFRGKGRTSSCNALPSGRTLSECNLRMLETEDACDVVFLLDSGHQTQKAHSYILMSRSCVFHTIINDSEREIYNIEVAEMTKTHLKQFLEYLYTDNIFIDSGNATALLHTSRKYAVNSLEEKCLHFLESNLNDNNACETLETAYRYEYEHLYDVALNFVKSRGQKCLQTEGFLNLSKDLLDEIVKSRDLMAFNHVIFNAIDNWSEKECVRQGRQVTPQSKQAVLGSTFYKMTFNTQDSASLTQELKVNNLADIQKEVFDRCASSFAKGDHLFMLDNDLKVSGDNLDSHDRGDQTSQKTADVNISPLVSASRYAITRHFHNYFGLPDAIVFRCNKNIFLHGFQLYGPFKGSDTYDLMTNILDNMGRPILLSVLSSSYETSDSDDVYSVHYDMPVDIKAMDWYTLVVKILGPESKAGYEGVPLVTCPEGVVFEFRNSERSKNGTSVTVGQIPAFLYSIQ